jgi:4-nitrophenyl phosphatase
VQQPEAILLDADGVLWRGREVIPEAPQFIERAQAAGIRCLLVSNNAGPNREAYLAKCRKLGLNFAPEDIFSVNHLAGPFVARNYPESHTLVIGSEMLLSSMREHIHATSGDEWLEEHGMAGRPALPDDLMTVNEASFDQVIIGIDVNVSYLKMALACVAVQRGADLLAANPDYSFPVPGGYELPGNGSIVGLIAKVSSVEPVLLGKPADHLLELIEEETGLSRRGMLMIGDRIETDIDFAINAGIPRYLVLTGVTSASQAAASNRPMDIANNLDELAGFFGI